MCIIDGGFEMRERMKKLVKYECKNSKCGKIWGLTPDMVVISDERIFCGFDFQGRKKWRKSGQCTCGTPFDYPSIKIKDLQDSYGNAWKSNQAKGSE